jgi:hypothetical protein
MAYGMTKVAAPTVAAKTPQHEEVQSSFYSPRRLKLYTLAEVRHCETSKTIMKYIEAKTIQDKNTGMTYKTRQSSRRGSRRRRLSNLSTKTYACAYPVTR